MKKQKGKKRYATAHRRLGFDAKKMVPNCALATLAVTWNK
jgi:hypothetical protein